MKLDPSARRNLELYQDDAYRGQAGQPAVGAGPHQNSHGQAGCIRQWLEQPLVNVSQINLRQDAVEALLKTPSPRRDGILEGLQGVLDMERLIGRIVYGIGQLPGSAGPGADLPAPASPQRGCWMAFAASTWRSCASRSIRWPTWPS